MKSVIMASKNSRTKTMRFARFQKPLIVALCGMGLAALVPLRSSAQAITYYDFNAQPSSIPASGNCVANFCFNYAGDGPSYIQDLYPPSIDPNANTDNDAGSNNSALQMTEAAASQSASMWFSIPQNVAEGFNAWYTVKLTPSARIPPSLPMVSPS